MIETRQERRDLSVSTTLTNRGLRREELEMIGKGEKREKRECLPRRERRDLCRLGEEWESA